MKKIKLWVVWNNILKNNVYASECVYKMESYCLKCKKKKKTLKTLIQKFRVLVSNGRVMILSKCAICGS